MTINEYIYFGAWWTSLHKNPVFRKKILSAFIILMEKGYFG